jgi:hypothetical protein
MRAREKILFLSADHLEEQPCRDSEPAGDVDARLGEIGFKSPRFAFLKLAGVLVKKRTAGD